MELALVKTKLLKNNNVASFILRLKFSLSNIIFIKKKFKNKEQDRKITKLGMKDLIRIIGSKYNASKESE
jgi:hypothetical protein